MKKLAVFMLISAGIAYGGSLSWGYWYKDEKGVERSVTAGPDGVMDRRVLNFEKLAQLACLNFLVWVHDEDGYDWDFVEDGIIIPVETINRIEYRLTPEGIRCTSKDAEE
jgi:hypothetical protein